jgi:hypothetical protein
MKKSTGTKRTASANGNSKPRRAKPRAGAYVLCIDNHGYPASLERGKVYPRLPARSAPTGWLRVVDESGDNYLFPASRFVRVELPTKTKRALALSGR